MSVVGRRITKQELIGYLQELVNDESTMIRSFSCANNIHVLTIIDGITEVEFDVSIKFTRMFVDPAREHGEIAERHLG